MRYISHRGNIHNRQVDHENTPEYIQEALDKGFDVEVDVWVLNGSVWLGHDNPKIKLPHNLFLHPKLWFHCKNVAAFNYFVSIHGLVPHVNYFMHNNDPMAITSQKYYWVHPEWIGSFMDMTNSHMERYIAVMPSQHAYMLVQLVENFGGICADNIFSLKQAIEGLK